MKDKVKLNLNYRSTEHTVVITELMLVCLQGRFSAVAYSWSQWGVFKILMTYSGFISDGVNLLPYKILMPSSHFWRSWFNWAETQSGSGVFQALWWILLCSRVGSPLQGGISCPVMYPMPVTPPSG